MKGKKTSLQGFILILCQKTYLCKRSSLKTLISASKCYNYQHHNYQKLLNYKADKYRGKSIEKRLRRNPPGNRVILIFSGHKPWTRINWSIYIAFFFYIFFFQSNLTIPQSNLHLLTMANPTLSIQKIKQNLFISVPQRRNTKFVSPSFSVFVLLVGWTESGLTDP